MSTVQLFYFAQLNQQFPAFFQVFLWHGNQQLPDVVASTARARLHHRSNKFREDLVSLARRHLFHIRGGRKDKSVRKVNAGFRTRRDRRRRRAARVHRRVHRRRRTLSVGVAVRPRRGKRWRRSLGIVVIIELTRRPFVASLGRTLARLGGGPGIFHRVRSFVRSRSSALDRRQSVCRDRSTPGTFHQLERAGWCAPEFALYAATGSLFSGRNFLS